MCDKPFIIEALNAMINALSILKGTAMENKRILLLTLCLMMGVSLLAWPTAVSAQDVVPPPDWLGEGEVSDDDIIVIEPQLFFELPFAQGFEISFNFGIKIRVPRRLVFISDDAYNFFLQFRSYVIPAEVEAITPTIEE